jgi:ABC-type Fe3+-hydroxamate transport system substrate-binding protein
MKTTCLIAGLAALALATPPIVSAQTQTPQTGAPVSMADVKKALGAPETVTATVAAVDFDERIVVLRTEAGMDRALYVGSEVSRFKNIKVGDRVTITYYMSLATALLQPGEAPGASAAGAVTTTPGTKPGGTLAEQVRWVVTVNSVDLKNQTVTVTGPRGRTVTVKAENKDRIAKLKPNDKIEVVLTAAAVVSMAPAR